MPIDPSTAFVSYSREDLEFVLRLAKDLKAKGAKVWMDKLDLRPGQLWDTEVEAAVDGCSRMLIILSPAAVASQKVKNEFMAALDDGKELIPVFFRECKVPLQLRRFQYADFRSDYSVGLEELLASLGGEQEVVSSAEAVALTALRESLGLDRASPLPPPVDTVEAAERERLEVARKQQEQAKLALIAETERKQREQAESTRLAAQAEADQKQRQHAEAARLVAQAEAERKQHAEAEAARLAAEVEHKTPRHAQVKKADPSRKVAILLGVLLLIVAALALKASGGLVWIMVGLVVGWATAMIKGGGGGIPVLGIFGGIIGAVVCGSIGGSLGLMNGGSTLYNISVPLIGAIIGALVVTWLVVFIFERRQG